jgi:hypothetical protein
MDQIAGAARYAEPLQLFRNKGDGTFEDISNAFAGFPMLRGAAQHSAILIMTAMWTLLCSTWMVRPSCF